MKKLLFLLCASALVGFLLSRGSALPTLIGIAVVIALAYRSSPAGVRRRIARLEGLVSEARHEVQYHRALVANREQSAQTRWGENGGPASVGDDSSDLGAEANLHLAEARLARYRAEMARLRARSAPPRSADPFLDH